MITLALEMEPNNELLDYQRVYSSIFRSAYKNANLSQKEIRTKLKERFPNENCWLIQCAIIDALAQHKAHKAQYKSGQRKKPVIWGGRTNFNKLNNGELTNDEWKTLRLRPITIIGEANHKSNRLFNFDLENQLLQFKPNKNTKILFDLKHLGKNQIQMLNELQQRIGLIPITIKFTTNTCHISYEPEIKNTEVKLEKYLGIDLNPSRIGCSIIGIKHIYKSWSYEISKETRSNDNKRNYEIIQVLHSIVNQAMHYKCKGIVIEKLTMGAKDQNKGRVFNKLVNNQWNTALVREILNKLCKINGIELIEVNCAYSSTVGNLVYNIYDPCASACEIARRGMSGIFLPEFNLDFVESLNLRNGSNESFDGIDNWIIAHKYIKTRKLRVRVPLGELQKSFRFQSRNSGITNVFITSY